MIIQNLPLKSNLSCKRRTDRPSRYHLVNYKRLSALLLSHLHNQMEIADFGSATVLPASLSARSSSPPPPSHFKAWGGWSYYMWHTLEGEKRGERIALLSKAEVPGSRMRCVSCCLMTVELFKIKQRRRRNISGSIFRLGVKHLTLVSLVCVETCKFIRVEISLVCCTAPCREMTFSRDRAKTLY